MQWLAGFATLFEIIGKFLPTAAGVVAAWWVKKGVFILATLTAFATACTVLYEAVSAATSTIVLVAPPGFGEACHVFLPGNANLCISAVLSTYVARWVFDTAVRVMTFKNAGAGF